MKNYSVDLDLLAAVIRTLMPLFAAFLVYWLGRSAYFRQKEYEIVVDRYLLGCLDVISEKVDSALGIFRHNWSTALDVTKHYRDFGADMRKELYGDIFIKPPPDQYVLYPFYRLECLTDDDIFHRAQQLLDSFTRNAYAFFQEDLNAAVRMTIEGSKEIEFQGTRSEFVEMYMNRIRELEAEANTFYVYLAELQHLSTLVQAERFSFDKIAKMPQRKEVAEILARMHATYDPLLSDMVESAKNAKELTDEPEYGTKISDNG